MKQLYVLAFLGLATLCAAQSNPENEIPIFDLDDYFVVPKFTVGVGFRSLSAPSSSFHGSTGVTNTVASTQGYGAEDTLNIVRNYHDGIVARDQRIDDVYLGNADNLTNTWRTTDAEQTSLDNQTVSFHSYSAAVGDNKSRAGEDDGNSYGVELSLSRDMGKMGNKFEWKLFTGMSMNGINNRAQDDAVPATITTVTDVYALPPPRAGDDPYPGLTATNYVNDPYDGSQIAVVTARSYNGPTATYNIYNNTMTDTSVLIGQAPSSRTITTESGLISSVWKLKGSFLTFRAGAQLFYNITDKFRLSVSVGPATTYVSTSYEVDQSLLPNSGGAVVTTLTEVEGKALFGYYIDANLEYLLTDSAGIYLGTVYQSTGIYDQNLSGQGSNYAAKLDLDGLQGYRAGMNFKF